MAAGPTECTVRLSHGQLYNCSVSLATFCPLPSGSQTIARLVVWLRHAWGLCLWHSYQINALLQRCYCFKPFELYWQYSAVVRNCWLGVAKQRISVKGQSTAAVHNTLRRDEAYYVHLHHCLTCPESFRYPGYHAGLQLSCAQCQCCQHWQAARNIDSLQCRQLNCRTAAAL